MSYLARKRACMLAALTSFHLLCSTAWAQLYEVGNDVGIGEDTPATKLHVLGNHVSGYGLIYLDSGTDGFAVLRSPTDYDAGFALKEGSTIRWQLYNDGNQADKLKLWSATGSVRWTVEQDGDLGLGTEAPDTRLHIQGNHASGRGLLYLDSNDHGFAFLRSATGYDAGISLRESSTDKWQMYNDGDDNDEFKLLSTSGVKMTVYQDGRVGIGKEPATGIKLDVAGTTSTEVLQITGADLAEKFPVSEEVEPGMVLAIDTKNPGQLCIARGEYNRTVAGIVSGANDFAAGAILGNRPGQENSPPVALSGRVYVQCDSSNGAIQPGDLLTTSKTPGCAMKVTDHAKAQGAVIGKAMTHLDSGVGLVLVLVSLQ